MGGQNQNTAGNTGTENPNPSGSAQQTNNQSQGLEERLKEKDRTITELSERLARAEELLNAMLVDGVGQSQQQTQQTSQSQSSSKGYNLIEDPEGTLERIKLEAKEEAKREMRQELMQMKSMEQLREKFFTEYPEMREVNPGLLTYFANETETKYPRAPIDEKFKKIAESTKAYIQKLRVDSGQQNPPPHIETGAEPMQGAGTTQQGEEIELEGVQADNPKVFEKMFEDRMKSFSNKLSPPSVGSVKPVSE